MATERSNKPSSPKTDKVKSVKVDVNDNTGDIINKKQMSISPVKMSQKRNILSPKAGMVIIKQIGSPIRRDPRQAIYLKSLGLGKINRVRQIVDTPSTRGLIDKLRHMIVVTEQ